MLALEQSLAQSLLDLIASENADSSKSVVIYRAIDIRRHLFSTYVAGNMRVKENTSKAFTQALSQCFKSGEHCIYQSATDLPATLFPLKNNNGHTIAIIAIENLICDVPLQKTISMLLQIFQNFIVLINDNEHDTLTGLLNRKTFEIKINKVLQKMQSMSKRQNDKPNQLYFLALFDIDHFKRVNDEFGHLIGDEVLLIFSQLMTQNFRSSDPLFRFGGEEFVGIFECLNPPDIELILNRFKEKVSSFNFPQVGKISVSAGYTDISPFDVSTQLIDRADLALYYAKNHGRNRICHFEQLVAEGLIQENKKEGDIELF
ncbi:MAG: GGDEF domain-containing protein [Methylococcales bacterium]